MGNKYFNAKRDRELIAAGTHFFCHACLVAKPASEQSPDERYCQGSYEFLLKEAKLLPATKHPKWIPKSHSNAVRGAVAREIRGEKPIPVVVDGVLNMSTVNGKNSKVDIFEPSVAKVTRGKRGPKQKPLPQELIKQWAGEDMGSKAIATRLKADTGVTVSYKTIQRLLSGKRDS